MTRPTFDAAVVALRDALKAAIDDPTFDRNDLSEVWRHYQGLQTITERIPGGAQSVFNTSNTGALDFGALGSEFYGNVAAGPVDKISISTAGQDVISFS